MKFCQPHWEMLRQAVRDQGMWELVAQSGEECAQRTVSQLEEGAQPANFDPLMQLHWMIVNRVSEKPDMLMFLMSGDHCPMCEAGKHCAACKEIVAGWPASAAAFIKEEYDQRVGGHG